MTFRNFSAGELSGRFSAFRQLCSMILNTGLSLILTSAISLLYILQIFRFTPVLVRPALRIVAVSVILSIASGLIQKRVNRLAMGYAVKTNGIAFAMISGVQKIRSAGAEKRAFAKWAEVYSKSAALTYNPPFLLKIHRAMLTAVSLTGTVILFYRAAKAGVAPSDYIAFNVAFGTLSAAFSSFTSSALSISMIQPILEMAEPILEAEPESGERRASIERLSGKIEFSNVFFRYKESQPYVVNGLNLKIQPGEYIAVTGSTGCGKSTLVRLMLGFEKPEKGAVYYDGVDMTKADLLSLRKQIGTVTQNGALFQGSIYSNIVISAPHLSLDEAWKAAELAEIVDDIRRMPMGMNTLITEGQGGISGGQKQRLMIARAIAPKPKILIFDEATSALDNKTQKKVASALDSLKCTRIVIAHRLSTVKNCDRILYLEDGRILEDGTYDELIQRNGKFAQLVRRQRLEQ